MKAFCHQAFVTMLLVSLVASQVFFGGSFVSMSALLYTCANKCVQIAFACVFVLSLWSCGINSTSIYATPTHIQICRGAGDAHILTHTPKKKNSVVFRKRAGGFPSQTDFLCVFLSVFIRSLCERAMYHCTGRACLPAARCLCTHVGRT